MSKLEEFYKLRDKMREGFPNIFNEEQWGQQEEILLQEELSTKISQSVAPALDGVGSPISITIDYIPQGDIRVKVSLKNAKNETTATSSVTEPEDESSMGVSTLNISTEKPVITRSESIGFTVAFPDGTFVKRKNAKETFIAALKVIGLARASSFRGRMFKGFPLVSRTHRKGAEWKCQEYVEGWYVYVNMSNEVKMEVLRQISDELRLDLVIRDDTGKIYTRGGKVVSSKQGGRRAMFRLNGVGPYNKRNFVFAAVKLYLHKYPNVTYDELEKAFPKELQGSYGVIARMSYIKGKQMEGHDHMGRYFTDDRHLLQTKDGAIFAVCTQWGDQFGNFINNVRRFGWTVNEE